MGSSYSKEEAKSPNINDSHNSARNVLEGFAKSIKKQAKDEARSYEHLLKGELQKAVFRDGHSNTVVEKKYNYSYPCNLDHNKHTNLRHDDVNLRHPCHGRYERRFDENALSECRNSRIKGNENKSDGKACAPPRRRHMCDKNLEALTAANTTNSDELLGNILVTAKYEGQSIVNNHPDKDNYNNTSSICTALARSFADIGDIVRGKDLFLGGRNKEKTELEINLKNIFENIKGKKEELNNMPIEKFREYWWAIHRKEVWEALTCSAPRGANYFVYKSDGLRYFSSDRCGHNNNDDPLTNLDYVPQYLRWYDEWAEEFCRKRNIKLKKIKDSCRDEKKGIYCSRDGHDCTQTNIDRNIFFVDLDCPNCEEACRNYKKWIENQEKQFHKQKKKYEYVINKNRDSSNNDYERKFYENLKNNYPKVDKFLEILNEGKHCQDNNNNNIENEMDFTNPDETFGPSEYCKACPFYGVTCTTNQECVLNNANAENDNQGDSTGIDILINDRFGEDIDIKLKEYCTKDSLFKVLKKQEWNCQCIENINRCDLKNVKESKNVDNRIAFIVLLERWLKDFLEGYIISKKKIEACKKKNENSCIKECKDKCECVKEWLNKKKKEWEKIKEHFQKQKDIYTFLGLTPYDILKLYLEDVFLDKIKAAHGIDEEIERIEVFIENNPNRVIKGSSKSEDIVQILMNYLLQEAESCLETHKKDKCPNVELDQYNDDDDDEEDQTHNVKDNPCIGRSGIELVKNVNDIAFQMQKEAHMQMLKNSGNADGSKDEIKLKADAKLGEYYLGGKGDTLTTECDITDQYSNRNTDNSKHPCFGKNNQRFVIGKIWSEEEKKKREYNDVYLPQRRQHMCTSNLEHLMTNVRGLTGGNASDSLLGDVLLGAKYEGQFIVDNIKSSNDKSEICRAMRNSFADIGDIIRGADLWVNNLGELTTQKNLVSIFGKIKSNLPENIKNNYNDKDLNHIKLREDWWYANRIKVWNAMKCSLGSGDIKCGPTPRDDYIPQFLRWMTEWAEWFCKMQKEAYNKLVTGCTQCKSNGDGKQCMHGDDDCDKCTEARDAYKTKIDLWGKQWETVSKKYQKLYEEARIAAFNGGPRYYTPEVDDKDKPVVDFLFKLYVQNGGKVGPPPATHGPPDKHDVTRVKRAAPVDTTPTVYHTAAGYIHQEAHIGDCQSGTRFCGTDTDKDYAFRTKPHNYDAVLNCGDKEIKKQKKKKKPKEEMDPQCEKVEEILRGNDGSRSISGCHNKRYNGWNCNKNDFHSSHTGACMPPRRQKLCVHFLADNKEMQPIDSQDKLREAFTKCAAVETLHSWYYYKIKNGKEDEKLESGKIPPDFLRSMYYTYGDFRDFLFGTDISKSHGEGSKLKEKIDSLFPNGGGKPPNGKTRQKWWDDNGPEIWKGMVCALTKGIGNEEKQTIKNTYAYKELNKSTNDPNTLENFAKKPQFLRWMIEWGEEFCIERKKFEDNINSKCNGPKATNTCKEGTPCKNACNAYEDYVKKKKGEFTGQTNRFVTKANELPQDTDYKGYESKGRVSQQGNDYLLKNCDNQKCSCMTGNVRSEDSSEKPFGRYAHNYSDKCNCLGGKPSHSTPPPPAKAPKEVPAKKEEKDEVRKMVEELLKDKGKHDKIHGCTEKEYNDWDCNAETMNMENQGACMPPRREKLCINDLECLNDIKELKTKFIICAAMETHFAWLHYKKKNNNSQGELEGGKIPESFLRIMYYTYGDYRDILFGTDILKNNSNTKTVINNINKFFNDINGNEEKDKEKRKEWWEQNGPKIWEGMLCALTNDLKPNEKTKILETYSHSKLKNEPQNGTTPLEKFAERSQFLRWFTEWGEEFCTERQKLEAEVSGDCKMNYEGCNKTNTKSNDRCANACNAYKKYITDKKEQYDKQNKKFDVEKRAHKDGYVGYYDKDASEYLKENCLDGTCKYMQKVKTIDNYWEKPHTTYEDEQLGIKCECLPTPCEIVDSILGDKSSKGYVEGCKTKYMTRSTGWLCNSGGSEKDGDLCIPPRRQRLYVKDLEEFTGETQIQLREAFIKCAAVETFFAWHEFKKEKERQKEEKKKDGIFALLLQEEDTLIGEKELQKQLEHGDIPDDFKRQMFYTFGDYRDLCLGNDFGKDDDNKNISIKIKSILGGQTTSMKTQQQFWEQYGKDVWEGMLCALSYDTEKKIKNEELRKKLTEKKKGNKTTYDKVRFSDNNSTLEKFASRPQFFRWLDEWGEEFCGKRTYKLAKIKEDCGAQYDEKKCSGDGEDCQKIVSHDYTIVPNLECSSCAISCKTYKKWINTKKKEFNKQKKIYDKQIHNAKSNPDNIYDKEFFGKLSANYTSIEPFLEGLKGACSNKNNGKDIINFKDTDKTFEPAEYCAPCPLTVDKCNKGGCNDITQDLCSKIKIKFKNTIKNNEAPNDINILVSDNSHNGFPNDLKDVCNGTDIFKGIREYKWSCKYSCGLDICELKPSDGKKIDKQNILIRALLKRWLENFLEDYNNIKDKISRCTKNGEASICINDCKNKCKCVEKWLETKKTEWGIVRDRFFNQHNVNTEKSYQVKTFLQQAPFEGDYKKAQDVVENRNERYKLWGCTGELECKTKEENEKYGDFITNLITALKDKITKCKTQHDKPEENCAPSPPDNDPLDTQSDTLLPPSHTFPPPFCNIPGNPCSTTSGATNIVSVTDIAQEIQKDVKNGMLKRSVVEEKSKGSKEKDSKGGKSAESVLKGDATKGKYDLGGNAENFNEEKLCTIKIENSNAESSRDYKYEGPCAGKDGGGEMFRVEKGWKSGGAIKTPEDVFLPPRREHFCTSNVEHLKRNIEGLSGANAVHSLLGDVLLSAKYEADYIKDKYKDQKNPNGFRDETTICRAIKYCFADLGDIIKGTDLWDQNSGEVTTQNRLKEVFGSIYKSLDKDIREKYKNTSPYLDLRKDWWEANRDQVWKAMQCPKTTPSSGDIKCDERGVPLDDYIPQRLRWMTEWSEWYCKIQKKEYEELVEKCRDCRKNGKNCLNGDSMCKSCKEACDTYNKKIKTWENQWKKLKAKYEELYQKATTTTYTTTSSGPKDEKDVVDFLKKLYQQNKENNNIYSTAAGYIHEEAKYLDCHTQTKFCDKKNGETTTNGGKENEDYAFKTPPKEYEEPCSCEDYYRAAETQQDTCEIVKNLLENKGEINHIQECKQRDDGTKSYSSWKCNANMFDDNKDVPCIPPRRQNLCLYYLKELNGQKENDLREAFIKTAATETFLSWKYYKSKNHNDATLLDIGIIPPEFLRSMFYTFADYKYICMDTNIRALTPDDEVSKAKQNIGKVFSQKEGKSLGSIDRKTWWSEYAPQIWEGMLCALSHASGNKDTVKNTLIEYYRYKTVTFTSTSDGPTLSEFSERPPFLRWFTEWGEDFCKQRKKQFEILQRKCEECTVSDSGTSDKTKTCDDKKKCDACKTECTTYQDWLIHWKSQYKTQSKKYDAHKVKDEYKSIDDVKNSTNAFEYLDKQLKQFTCENGACSCMQNASKQQKQSPHGSNNSMPESLDEKPKEVKDKCNCIRDECNGLSVTHSGFSDGHAFGGGVPADKCTSFQGGLPKKPVTPQSDYINNILSTTIPVGIALALGSIAFLFIKKKPKSPVELLRILDIHKGDYGIPTPKSSNRYIPYVSDTYKGKTYIYMEGDTSGDEDKYIGDITSSDITSSESEYEEMDINDIYVPGSPKYKTLIEVVLEPSKSNGSTLGDDMVPTTNTFTDEEWNEIKHDFISQYLEREPLDVPQYDVSTELPMNIVGNILDHGINEKSFITSIHDRDLYTGEEISYNINMSTNSMDDPKYVSNNVYSGIDLINDTLSGNQHIDIYDEVLKRKENELFGTNYKKNTSKNSVAKNTNSDPIMNQLDLLHKWLDRHRDMCEKWNNKEELLDKLKEQWNKDNNSADIPNDNKTLNTNVSIEIDMDDPKGKKEFSNMDTILDDMEDDIYYDVNDENPSVNDIPMDHNKVDVPKKVHVEMKILNNRSNGSLEQEFPISDVWNI
ncbi:erythrocyte membrane protein 1, PfEMP1, putative [Plasmodium sp.]|nr:erythrocyte membrane protein 1, PfEMP1, putative [Plasmodium sp.]